MIYYSLHLLILFKFTSAKFRMKHALACFFYFHFTFTKNCKVMTFLLNLSIVKDYWKLKPEHKFKVIFSSKLRKYIEVCVYVLVVKNQIREEIGVINVILVDFHQVEIRK